MKENVYKKVLTLSLPIALQNIFVTAVSSADVIMIGYVSQDALSAVSLAGQIQFVLNLIFLGLTLGTSLMCAQYWGTGYNCDRSKKSSKIKDLGGLVLIRFRIKSILYAVCSVERVRNE